MSSAVREKVVWAADTFLGREWSDVAEGEGTDAPGTVVETQGQLGASEFRRVRSSAVLRDLGVCS